MSKREEEQRDLFLDLVRLCAEDRETENRLRIKFGYSQISAYRKDFKDISDVRFSILLDNLTEEVVGIYMEALNKVCNEILKELENPVPEKRQE